MDKDKINIEQIVFRELTAEDICSCTNLILCVYEQDGLIENETKESIAKDLKQSLCCENYKEKYFIAEFNKEIVGVAGVAQSFMSNSSFELFYGTVKKDFQRIGIGSYLTKLRIEYIKEIKKHGYIFVSARYPKFFEKIGFNSIINKKNDGAICFIEF